MQYNITESCVTRMDNTEKKIELLLIMVAREKQQGMFLVLRWKCNGTIEIASLFSVAIIDDDFSFLFLFHLLFSVPMSNCDIYDGAHCGEQDI